MTSRERVKRAILFQDPDRVPYNFDSNRSPDNGHLYGEDMLWTFLKTKPRLHATDEWGIQYESLDDRSFGEPKVFPLQGREDLEGYEFPTFTQDWRYEDMKHAIAENNGEKYVLCWRPFVLFQSMIDLFSFEDFLCNCVANPEIIEEVCDHLTDEAIAIAKIAASLGVDAMMDGDDTALQDRPMMSMDTFRELFVPRFARYYKACRDLGLDCITHSCGYTYDILEELIGAGVDVVNLDQQDNMGIDKLSKRYKGHVCFFCPMDIQRTLNMNREQLFERARIMKEAFSTEHGGFIAKLYPQPLACLMTDEYLQNVSDAFKAVAPY